MLSAILKQFESDLQGQKKSDHTEKAVPSTVKSDSLQIEKKVGAMGKTASVEDFARFLSSKGLFDYKEWEDFQAKKNG